jgi:hypothetical protein
MTLQFDNYVNKVLSIPSRLLSENDNYYGSYYHGTHYDALKKILSDKNPIKYLLPNSEGSKKVSAGLTSEKDFVYLTPNYDIAKEYAGGYEGNMYRRNQEDKLKFGGVVEVEIPPNIKLINFDLELSDENLEIVNSFLPSYKPIKKGESLSRFPFRSNEPGDLGKVIEKLGFDGYIQNKVQIAILGKVPIKAIYDVNGRIIYPEKHYGELVDDFEKI